MRGSKWSGECSVRGRTAFCSPDSRYDVLAGCDDGPDGQLGEAESAQYCAVSMLGKADFCLQQSILNGKALTFREVAPHQRCGVHVQMLSNVGVLEPTADKGPLSLNTRSIFNPSATRVWSTLLSFSRVFQQPAVFDSRTFRCIFKVNLHLQRSLSNTVLAVKH